MITKPYDGSTFRTLVDLQVYDGAAWQRVKRLWSYDGATWQEVSPPILWSVTWVDGGAHKAKLTFSYDTNVVKSVEYRTKIEANPFSAWAAVSPLSGTGSDQTPLSPAGLAGDSIQIQVRAYSALAAGGDLGGTYDLNGIVA